MKTLLTLCLLMSSIAFAGIQNPEDFTGIEDHQTLKIRIVEIFNGGVIDYDGIGAADFRFELELETEATSPVGQRIYKLDNEAELLESDIFEMPVGSIDRDEKVIEIPGKVINDHVREFHEFTTSSRYIIRLYEDVPTLAGLASVFLPGNIITDEHIGLKFIKVEDLASGHLEVLITDDNYTQDIKVEEEVGFLGMGGLEEVTKTVGKHSSNSYAKIIFEIE